MNTRRLALGLALTTSAIAPVLAQPAFASPAPADKSLAAAFPASAEVVATPAAEQAVPAGNSTLSGEAPAVTPSTRRLSNERTLTAWAHPAELGPIYAAPGYHARQVGNVHAQTEDGFPEVYMLLALHIDARGREWIKLRIPGRPNGREGWVLRELLGTIHHTHWLIVVDRATQRLTAYYNGHVRMVAPVGVGKPSTPTPAGHFWIRERFRITERSNPYWPYALGTSDYSTLTEWPGGGVVGLHGDFGEPTKIPGDPSHGCVRMRDPDIAKLGPMVTLGTPVEIL